MPGGAVTARLFGKLPAHGDFVARGCDAAQRAELDQWLAVSLAEARAHYGDEFAGRFDQALPWRGAGEAVAGAVAPSQDSTGRRFPIVLLCAGDGEASARCEELLYSAIGSGWDADRLVAAAGEAPPGDIDHWYLEDARRENGSMPPGLLTAMLA